ncbi:MAG TPA: prepilin peptidase [Caulobacteraceae bacterium]|nr:prepilin peptidase [Caulobacteraceae bacterium]
MSPDLAKTLVALVFSALVLAAALRDLATYTIPNWVSAALAIGFAPAALALGVPLAAVGISLLLGAGLLLVGIALFALRALGGGDAKLMAAAAPWLGLAAMPRFLVYTGLAGGALALALLVLRSDFVRPLANAGPAWARRLATPGEMTPYGVAIAAGALAAFPAGMIMQLAHGGF